MTPTIFMQESMESIPQLEGAELIAKVEECSGLTKSEIALACGYSKVGLDGKRKPAFAAFYEALIEARTREPKELENDPLSVLSGADTSKIVLNVDLIRSISKDGKLLDQLSEDEAADFIRRVFTAVHAEEPPLLSLTYFDPDDATWLGYVDSKEWTLSFGEEDEGATLIVCDIEYEKQFSEIQEILAGADRERPGLEDFFVAMSSRMRNGNMSYYEAWNEVVFDDTQGKDSVYGHAIADFRDGELLERLGYEPSPDALDDALEQWISNFY